jgi:hypothetical protein
MPLASLQQIVQSTAAAAAAGRLLSAGLARRQAGLFSFVAVYVVCAASLAVLSPDSPAYFWAYLFFDFLSCCLSVWSVAEMFTLSMIGYPGIRTAALRTLFGCLAFSALLTLAIALASWGNRHNGKSHLYYVEVADRSIVFALAVVVAGLIWFLSRYPLHLHRNTYVSCGFFSALLLIRAGADLLYSFSPHFFSHYVDPVEAVLCCLAFLGWACLLTSESAPRPVRVSYEKPDERELLRQLDAMNRMLGGVERR